MASYNDAKNDKQHGPAVRCAELLGKHLAMFSDRLVIEEQGVSDDDLIEAMAKGDEHKRDMLRDLLGAPDTFDGMPPIDTTYPGQHGPH